MSLRTGLLLALLTFVFHIAIASVDHVDVCRTLTKIAVDAQRETDEMMAATKAAVDAQTAARKHP